MNKYVRFRLTCGRSGRQHTKTESTANKTRPERCFHNPSDKSLDHCLRLLIS